MAGDRVPAKEVDTPYSKLTRHDFDTAIENGHFVFGTGTAAYQVEGGAAKGGRGLSIWDAFTLRTPGRIEDGSNGNDAADMYNRYKEDIKMMKNMGFDAYRFSISWTRILPGGRICFGVNQEGIDYYNDLIDTLIDKKITPFVTLFHWDLPHTLEQEYKGFLSSDIVNDFREFAELCFWKFGDRVKHWVTLNEPWTYTVHGYVNRFFPPGTPIERYGTFAASSGSDMDSASSAVLHTTKTLLSDLPTASAREILDLVSQRVSTKPKRNFISYRGSSSSFNFEELSAPLELQSNQASTHCRGESASSKSAKEAYIVAKNLLLAHAAAVETYRTKFQKHQNGTIGITLVTHWFEPFDDEEPEDKEAAERALDFMLGWFLEPVLRGEYPESMRKYASKHIALFSDKESRLLRKAKIDFLGLNYYTANYAKDDPKPNGREGYFKDQKIQFLDEKDGRKIGEPSGAPWLFIVPWGFKKLLKYIDDKYANEKYQLPDIYITENGVCEKDNYQLTHDKACADPKRVNYYRDHLGNLHDVMKEMRTKVLGYFAWSWCDNFEWKDGYTMRFGIVYIDYKCNFTRHPKHSAAWFSKFLAGKQDGEEEAKGGDGAGQAKVGDGEKGDDEIYMKW